MKRKITIEDLISLKKAERPPAEFWTNFESELRAKQLAAIVGRRSAWDVFTSLFAVIYRRHLPFGAVAALALTWVGVHYMSAPSAGVHQVSVAPLAVRTVSREAASVALAAERQAEPAEVAQAVVRETAPAEQAPVVAANASHVMPAPVAVTPDSPQRSPFSDVVAVNLSDFRESQPDLARRSVFGSDREFEATVASMHVPSADPLSRLDPASEERRSRLLAPALPAYASSASRTFASERMKQSASDDRMYESMDPYGSARPISLEFKF